MRQVLIHRTSLIDATDLWAISPAPMSRVLASDCSLNSGALSLVSSSAVFSTLPWRAIWLFAAAELGASALSGSTAILTERFTRSSTRSVMTFGSPAADSPLAWFERARPSPRSDQASARAFSGADLWQALYQSKSAPSSAQEKRQRGAFNMRFSRPGTIWSGF